MRCLIYSENFNVEVLKLHYECYHSVDPNNYFFRELFTPDNNSKRCDECKIQFKNWRQKKNHNFLFHRNQQTGGSVNRGPVNILRWRPITYFSINFQQHNRFYDFYNESVVDSFFNSVKDLFTPAAKGKEYKIQAYFELKKLPTNRICRHWKY